MITDDEIVARFHALYCGGLAEKKRAAGDKNALPPWAQVYWLGKQVVKNPADLWVYQELISETRPDLIVETGTSGGGSAYYFATICDLIGTGNVITVDKDEYPDLWVKHPRITYLVGDSVSSSVAHAMRSAASGRRCMVVLDSLHTYSHVKRELELYAPLVTSGCYLVIEDTGLGLSPVGEWCNRAAYEFLQQHSEFKIDRTRERHLLSSNHDGWLLRV